MPLQAAVTSAGEEALPYDTHVQTDPAQLKSHYYTCQTAYKIL